jgi:hypothetical protein
LAVGIGRKAFSRGIAKRWPVYCHDFCDEVSSTVGVVLIDGSQGL